MYQQPDVVAPDRDKETGQFNQEYPRDQFIEAIDELGTPTTSSIANYVGCSYNLAYRRLTKLAEDGEISKTKVGKTYLWSR